MALGSAFELDTFVPISQVDRALDFYQNVLGLDLIENTPFALVFRSPGGALRLARTPSFSPQPFTVASWVVRDIADDMATLSARGVSFEQFDGIDQDEDGVWTVPDGTRIAWFKDPDGNLLSIAQKA